MSLVVSTHKHAHQGLLVKLQVLTLAAKLFLLCPTDQRLSLLCRHVLSLGRYDQNYDVRDRTRMLNSLLVGVSPTINGGGTEEQGGVVLRREQVMKVLFDGKAGIVEESDETLGALLFRGLDMIPTFCGEATTTYRLVPLVLSRGRPHMAILSSQNG